MKRQYIFGHLLTLLIGSFIYILFRTETLKMFSWFNSLNLEKNIKILRNLTFELKAELPNWFLFSLPDGLWLFSYVSLILIFWKNKINRKNIFWILFLPFLAIFSEIAQFFNLLSGTFDAVDLLFYLFGTLLPIYMYTNSIIFKTKKL
jgi:hypothetical protein